MNWQEQLNILEKIKKQYTQDVMNFNKFSQIDMYVCK